MNETCIAFSGPTSNMFLRFPILISRDMTNPSRRGSIAGFVTYANAEKKIKRSWYLSQKAIYINQDRVQFNCRRIFRK